MYGWRNAILGAELMLTWNKVNILFNICINDILNHRNIDNFDLDGNIYDLFKHELMFHLINK